MSPARGQQIGQRLTFEGAEVRFARLPEDRRDVAALGFLDPLVDVFEAPVETSGERAAHGRLAGAHEAHEVELVGLHARRPSSAAKKPGKDTAATSAP